MSERHQQNDDEDDDDDEFLVTPRVRDRFGQGFSQYSQQRFDRPSHPSRESHYSQWVTPRSSYPAQRSNDYYNNRPGRYHERPYSHQRPYDDHYSHESQYDDQYFHQRPHDDYHFSVHRSHDTHFSEHMPYESYYTHQTTIESHRPLCRIPVRRGGHHHFPERSYGPSHSPPYRSEGWDEGQSHHNRREHSQNEPNGSPFGREGWLNASPDKRHKFRDPSKVQLNRASQRDPLNNLSNSNKSAKLAKSQQRTGRQQSPSENRDKLKPDKIRQGNQTENQQSPSENRNQLKPDKIRHGNQNQTLESRTAKLKQPTVGKSTQSAEDLGKCDKIRTEVKDKHIPERDKKSNNSKHTKELSDSDKYSKEHLKEKYSFERKKDSDKTKHQRKSDGKSTESAEDLGKCDKIRTEVNETHIGERDKNSNNIKHTKEFSEHDKHSKEHLKGKHSFERKKHSDKTKHQRRLSERDKPSYQGEHKRQKSIESTQSFENRNAIEKNTVSKKRKEVPALALHSSSDESDLLLNAERQLLDLDTINKQSLDPCNQSSHKNQHSQERTDPVKKREKIASREETERTAKKQDTNCSDSSGVISNSQAVKSSKVHIETVTKMGETASKLLRKSENKDVGQFKDKKEKSKEFESKHVSKSINRSADYLKSSSLGDEHVSSKRAERKSSQESPSFDFATGIFTTSQKSLSKKDSKQGVSRVQSTALSEARKKSVFYKKEKFSDHKTEQKHQKETVVINGNKVNKHMEKDTDSSDADAELNQFKSILTQVNESRWKTKPLHIDSRRASSQSVKSTDSSASVSLLQSAAESKCLSQKAYRKYGVTNLEYRKKKLYYRGVRIRRAVVRINKQDIQNVFEHKKMLKRKLQKVKEKKIKFKRIKAMKDSSPELDIDKRNDSSALLKSFDNTPITASDDDSIKASSRGSVSPEYHGLNWLVPDSHEESDWSDRTSEKRQKMKDTKPKKIKRNKIESHNLPSKKPYSFSVKGKFSNLNDFKKRKNYLFGKKKKTNQTATNCKHIVMTGAVSNSNKTCTSDSVSDSEFETKSIEEKRHSVKIVRKEDETKPRSMSWKRKQGPSSDLKDNKTGQDIFFKKKAVNTKNTNTFIQDNVKTNWKESSSSVSGSDDESQFENINSDRLKTKVKTKTESDSSISDMPKVETNKIETVSSDATVKTCTVALTKIDKQQSKKESTEESGLSDRSSKMKRKKHIMPKKRKQTNKQQRKELDQSRKKHSEQSKFSHTDVEKRNLDSVRKKEQIYPANAIIKDSTKAITVSYTNGKDTSKSVVDGAFETRLDTLKNDMCPVESIREADQTNILSSVLKGKEAASSDVKENKLSQNFSSKKKAINTKYRSVFITDSEKSKTKESSHSVSDNDDETKVESIKSDILQNKTVGETETEGSESDMLDKETIKDAVAKIGIQQVSINDSNALIKSQIEDPPVDEIDCVTSIPETQLSQDLSTSSEDLPVFQTSQGNEKNEADDSNLKSNLNETEDKTLPAKIGKRDSLKSFSKHGDYSSEVGTQETCIYSCGIAKDNLSDTVAGQEIRTEAPIKSPVFTAKNLKKYEEAYGQKLKQRDNATNGSSQLLPLTQETSKSLINPLSLDSSVSMSTDNEQSVVAKAGSAKYGLSPEEKIKKGFKTFRSRFLKSKQRQRKERLLKSQTVKQNLKHVLLGLDETGAEADIEDNTLIESLSESEDSDFYLENSEKHKPSEHVKTTLSKTKFVQEPSRDLFEDKDKILSVHIQSLSEKENSNESAPTEMVKNDGCIDRVLTGNKSRPQQEVSITDHATCIGKTASKETADVSVKKEKYFSSSQKAFDGDFESEEIIMLDTSGIQIENIDNMLPGHFDIESKVNKKLSHDNICETDKNVKMEEKLDSDKNRGDTELRNPSSLLLKQSSKSAEENQTVQDDSQGILDQKEALSVDLLKVKDEPVKIKEEPEWKFMYTQEPDAIFISDIDDNTPDIIASQVEAFQVDSDSNDSDFPSSSQAKHLSLHDSEIQDPEYYDFSSPENSENDENGHSDTEGVNTGLGISTEQDSVSNKEELSGVQDKNNSVVTCGTIKDQPVKQENTEKDDDVISNRSLKDDDIEESFSESEASDDANYVEISSCESNGGGNLTLKSEEMAKNSDRSSAVNILDEEPSSDLPLVSTLTDYFDPYAYETQVDASQIPPNKRINAILKAVNNNMKSYVEGKCSNENDSADETSLQKLSISGNMKNRYDFLDDSVFEANTQIRKSNHATEDIEHDALYGQASQTEISKMQTVFKKGDERGELSGSDNLDENTFSDSSLVDTADKQTDLYIQCRVRPNESTSRFAEGLRIRYQDDEFMIGPGEYLNEGEQSDRFRVEDKSIGTNKTSQRRNIFGNVKELSSFRGSSALNNDKMVNENKSGEDCEDDGKTESQSAISKQPDMSLDACDAVIEMGGYFTNTQVDAACESTLTSASDKNEVKTAHKDEYALQKQKLSVNIHKSDDEIDYADNQLQPSVDEIRSMTAVTSSPNKKMYHMSEQHDVEKKNRDSVFNNDRKEELAGSESGSYDGKSAYGALTQTDVRPSNINSEDSEQSDHEDAYACMTQVDIRHSEPESLDDEMETDKDGKNAYSALTQKDSCPISSDSENDQYYFANTQVDITYEKDPIEEELQAIYDMETQIEADTSILSDDSKEQTTIKYTEVSTHKETNKSPPEKNVSLTKDLNSTVMSRSASRENAFEEENKLDKLKEKVKQSRERKSIEIPMQKAKSYYEKKLGPHDPQFSSKAYQKVSVSRKDQSRRCSTEAAQKNISEDPPLKVTRPLDDVTFYSATKSDMWLSKNTTKPSKPSMKPPAKRKRRATGDAGAAVSFKKSVLDARRQLADRNYQTIFKPEKKQDTQRKQKTEISPGEELEDVDLPTCSQIISKGLPILNPTDMLVKKNKPQTSSSRFSSRAATLTESMVESKSPPGKDVTKNVSVTKTTTEVTSTNADGTTSKPSLGPQKSVSGKSSSAIDLQKNYIHTSKQANMDIASKIKAVDSSGKNKSEDSTATCAASQDIAAKVMGKDNAEDEKSSVSSKQRKRRLSRMSQNSDYMPETKALKTVPNTSSDSIPGSHKGHKSVKELLKKQHSSDTYSNLGQNSKQTSQNDIAGTSAGENASRLEVRKPSTESRDKTSDAQPFRRVGGSNTEKHKDIKRNKTIQSAKTVINKSSVNSDEPQAAKAVPAWTISVKDAQRKPESAMTGKAVKKVTFVETVPSNKNTSNVAPEPNVTQSVAGKPNPIDPSLVQKTNKVPVDKVNLMLKTPLQSSDLSRPISTGPQSRPPQPFHVMQNRVPVPAHPYNPVNQDKGITFKEFLAVLLRWNPIWFEEHAKHLVTNRNAEPPPCTTGLRRDDPSLTPHSVDPLPLYPLLEKYKTFKEYSDDFMVPLLLYETWESSFQTWHEKQNRKTVLKHRFCPSGSPPVSDGGDKLNECVLLSVLNGTNQFFSEGDLVILDMFGVMLDENNRRREPGWVKQIALVERVIFRDTSVDKLCHHNNELAKMRKPNSFSVRMILKTRRRKFYPDYKVLGEVTQVGSVVTTMRQFKALEHFQSSSLCRDILMPTNNETFCDQPALTASCIKGFNSSQQRAISTASLMVSRPNHLPRICLLQGPPGTGKSHTVVGIINQILRDKQQKARICLCAQSHTAVDELLRRLDKQNKLFKQKGIGSSVKLIRIGKPSSVHDDVRYLCLDKLIEKNVRNALTAEKEKQQPQSLLMEKELLEKKIKTLKAELKTAVELKKKKLKIDLNKLESERQRLLKKCKVDISQVKPSQERERTMKYDLLYNAQVIAGTLNGIGSSVLKQFFETRKENWRQGFDCIIIDEATQAIELDTLIPLQYGTTKLILVGDPEQLPAVVVSQVAIDNKFNLSLFERLNSHFRYSNYNPVIMLDTQYRMDPQICSFPSNYIYDGKLKTDSSVYSRSQCPLEPYLLFDIEDGKEQLSQCSGSVSNPVEALFTVRLVEYIIENTNVTTNVIGIIAPYQKQKTLLVKHLQDSSLNGLHEIEVSTVDGFQGREKHVIIMSCVRAKSSSGTIGFLGSRNRMNVSLTRAKYALYVIAHFDSLEKSDEWKALIEDADQRKKRIPVNESSVEKALRNCLKRHTGRPP